MTDGPLGHPFWRRSPNGKDYVLIGRLAAEEADEVWTWSRRCVRDLRSVLEADVIWSRSEWERDVCARGKLYERGQSIRCTMIRDGVDNPSVVALRIFECWVADGVLRRPTEDECANVSSDWPVRALTRSRDRWIVDEAARDLWFAPRLLLMDDWRPSVDYST